MLVVGALAQVGRAHPGGRELLEGRVQFGAQVGRRPQAVPLGGGSGDLQVVPMDQGRQGPSVEQRQGAAGISGAEADEGFLLLFIRF